MATVVQPSRNPMLNKAWSDYKREQRGEKKKPAEPEPAPAKKAPATKKAPKKGGRK
jgi:hypothetical protein